MCRSSCCRKCIAALLLCFLRRRSCRKGGHLMWWRWCLNLWNKLLVDIHVRVSSSIWQDVVHVFSKSYAHVFQAHIVTSPPPCQVSLDSMLRTRHRGTCGPYNPISRRKDLVNELTWALKPVKYGVKNLFVYSYTIRYSPIPWAPTRWARTSHKWGEKRY